MENNEQNSKIERLKKSLYSRNNTPVAPQRTHLQNKQYDVNTDWEHKKEDNEEIRLLSDQDEGGSSFLHKILIGSVIFFILALAIGVFILFRGSNIVSADNLDISITGPASVSGGEVLSFDVKVTNKNNVKLELVDLSVEFPAGTVEASNNVKELTRFRQSMKDLEPKASDTKKVQAILFGEENSKKEIDVKVEYRVPGSNAVFYKEKIYDVYINSSPITLQVSSFKEVNAGEEFELAVEVKSNSTEVLKNVLLKADYPFGYSYINSDPSPTADTNLWRLGDIAPKARKIIKINGRINAQDNEERVFKFATGIQSTKNPKIIGTQFVAVSQPVNIKKPFFASSIVLNGNSGDIIGRNNEPINGEVVWSSNISSNMINGEIKLVLGGTALDRSTVSVNNGYYRSIDNTIIWDKTTAPELGSISPGETGRFSFKVTPRVPGGTVNPTISMAVGLNATRVAENNVPEQVISSALRNVKVATNVDLSGQTLRTVGPFGNSGPIPPKADTKSTYTIIWTISNSSSNITGTVVRSSLPPYVRWTGNVHPSGERVAYDEVNRSIVWNVGSVAAYTGVNTPRKEVAFQVELLPSINQVGQSPVLVNEVTLSATDQFTGASLNATQQALTTRFSTDPVYRSGDENVRN